MSDVTEPDDVADPARLDALSAELVRRYRNGEASVESLLDG